MKLFILRHISVNFRPKIINIGATLGGGAVAAATMAAVAAATTCQHVDKPYPLRVVVNSVYIAANVDHRYHLWQA